MFFCIVLLKLDFVSWIFYVIVNIGMCILFMGLYLYEILLL